MDFLPDNISNSVEFYFRMLLVLGTGLMAAFVYIQAKEAKKMENKLDIDIPKSVSIAMNAQLVGAFMFLIASLFLLFIF